MNKASPINGVTGQDGAYHAELLLAKGYIVHGTKRRASLFNTGGIDRLYQDPHVSHRNFVLHYGDLTDSTKLIRIIKQVKPEETYNLPSIGHVAVSFETPECSTSAVRIGTLRNLEGIRILGLEEKPRFYQTSSVAKLYGYWITVNFWKAYRIYACNGILFKHESPLRGETFVTRMITRGLARIFVARKRNRCGLPKFPMVRRCQMNMRRAA